MIDKNVMHFENRPFKTNGQIQEKFNTSSKTVVALPKVVTVSSGSKKLKYSMREVIVYVEIPFEDTPNE